MEIFSKTAADIHDAKPTTVVVNVMLSLMSVMSPPSALCNLSVRTAVKLCSLGVLALGVSLVP